MDGNSNNPLLDQLPTQNEIYQSHNNNNNNNNNEQTPSNYIPPPIYDNNIPQEITQDNNDNNDGRLSCLEAPPAFDNNQKPSIQEPLSQDNNNYPSQTDINENNSNIYNKPIDHPLNIPSPQSIEEEQKSQGPSFEFKEPVYQLQVMPQQQNYNRNNSSCCEDCCDGCCSCDGCCDDCNECCRNINWLGILRGLAIGLGAAARALAR